MTPARLLFGLITNTVVCALLLKQYDLIYA